MTIDEIIKNRRSIRLYSSEEVDNNLLKQVIDAGRYAPSASNKQLWYFIIINEERMKKKIFNAGATHILLSPQSIFVLYGDPDPNWKYPDDIESASACVQNILLKAYELGLGTCWVNHLPEEKVLKKILKIPSYFKIAGQINIGYPRKEPKEVKRKKKLNEMISYNIFSSKYIMKIESKKGLKKFLSEMKRYFRRIRKDKSKSFGWDNLRKPKTGWPGLKSNNFEE